ncbi:tRNA 2'-phosphotransferase [Clarireedia jacksonii]
MAESPPEIDRDKFGFNGYYRVRKVSNNLGQHLRHSPHKFKALVDPAQNPVRDQRYEAQIAFHDLHLKPRQLRYNLEKYTNKGRRYKQAYIQKEISKPNRIKRVDYGQIHENETVDSFWQFCLFTDEAHFDPASQGTGRILREQGQRYEPENIQEKPALLEFYNDEEKYVEKPRRPRKPRKSRYETEEDWNKRLMAWEAQIGHEKVVKPKGNSMTQEYYVRRLLPHYIDAIKDLSKKHSVPISQWRLIEDGDGSHGLQKEGLASRLKKESGIINLSHPPQSPDLNPIEAVWNILKQRLQWPRLKSLKPTFEDIRTAVTDNAKQRFSMKPNPSLSTPPSSSSENPGDWVIRANQGHSIAIDSAALLVPITLEADNVPETVVHGTYFAFYDAIVESGGLKKMGRNHVHFGTGWPEEKGVVRCLREEPEMKWWLSENGVVLTEGNANGVVGTRFWKKVVGRREGGLLWENGVKVGELEESLRRRWAPQGKIRDGGGARGARGGRGSEKVGGVEEE